MEPLQKIRINWPLSSEHELLLKAAMLPGKEALEAWRAWKRKAIFASLDINSRCLLPLLYKNLAAHEAADPLIKQMRNLYRYNRLRNLGFLRDLATVLEVWREQGIPVMVLKGMALALAYYEDIGLRPMHDLDLLVRREDALRAIELLIQNGWSPGMDPPGPFNDKHLVAYHEHPFQNKSGTAIDLHWHSKQVEDTETDDGYYWNAAMELRVMDASALAMNPTDMLFYALAHGLKHRGDNAPRMMADIHTILVRFNREVQWSRLISKIGEANLVLPARSLFRYMINLLHTPIPNVVQNHLAAIKVPGQDRLSYYVLNKLPGKAVRIFETFTYLAQEYMRTKQEKSLAGGPLGVAQYFKQKWRLNHLWQVPVFFVYRIPFFIIAIIRS